MNMANKNKRSQINKAVHSARLLAIASHPATTLLKILLRLRIPATFARKVAVLVFPSIKRLF